MQQPHAHPPTPDPSRVSSMSSGGGSSSGSSDSGSSSSSSLPGLWVKQWYHPNGQGQGEVGPVVVKGPTLISNHKLLCPNITILNI